MLNKVVKKAVEDVLAETNELQASGGEGPSKRTEPDAQGLGKLNRSSLEAYGLFLVTAAYAVTSSFGIPVNFWIGTLILVAMAGCGLDLLWHSPLTVGKHVGLKIAGTLVLLLLAANFTWDGWKQTRPKPDTEINMALVDAIVQKVEGVFQPGEGFLQISEVTPHEPLLVENAKMSFNVASRNASEQPVLESYALYQVAVLDLIKQPNWNDKTVLDKFQTDFVKPWQSEIKEKGLKGDEVGAGKATWGTPSVGPLDRTSIDAIRTGRSKVYILGYAQWKTMRGRSMDTSLCTVLQPPGFHTDANELVWHHCHL